MNPADSAQVISCPSREELAAFRAGSLPLEALESVADHLAGCPRCASAVQDIPDLPDDLLSDLRRLKGSGDLGHEAPSEPEMALLEASGADPSWFGGIPAAEESGAPEVPEQLGEYRLLEKLGQGGMGAVYRALHLRLEKAVAVKVLPAHRMNDPEAVARFRREMKAVGKLAHPHIVQATDAGEAGGTHFLVMELVEGTDLARLVKSHGTLPVADACELARQTASALQYIHEHGLVHRDVKPSNLLLTPAGKVKVLDLGLALLQGAHIGDDASTASSLVLGSFDYMAPEQGDDAHAVDGRADLYGLGCTLYHLLSGQPPFPAPRYRTPIQKLKAHSSTPVPPIRGRRPDVPEELALVLDKLLAKEPAGRFATAAEVAQALKPFAVGSDLPRLVGQAETGAETQVMLAGAEGSVGSAELPASGTAPIARLVRAKPHRLRRLVAAAACLAAAALLAGIVYVLTDKATPEITGDEAVPAGAKADGPPQVLSVQATLQGHTDAVHCVAFAPDGKTLASAGPDGIVRLWDVRTKETLHTLQGPGRPATCLAFSPDSKTLASASAVTNPEDGTIYFWDVATGREAGTLKGHPRGLLGLAFSPDGQLLASGGFDKTVRVWDLKTRRERWTLDDPEQPYIRCVTFFPDGRTVVSAGVQMTLWDVATGERKSAIPYHSMSSVKVSPNGLTLAAARYLTGTITLFEVATGQPLASWQAHGAAINDLTFSADGRLLASSGNDETARLWDTSGRPIAVLDGHRGPVHALAFAADGRTLATAGHDRTVKLWDVSAFAGRRPGH